MITGEQMESLLKTLADNPPPKVIERPRCGVIPPPASRQSVAETNARIDALEARIRELERANCATDGAPPAPSADAPGGEGRD